jgi:CheY-like chemotaxis protein/tetratricopeptide (TPR) repeat protein
MNISRQLIPRIADPSLSQGERARLRCQFAKELEDVGNYEAAREAMGELWSRVGEHPTLDELDEATAAEVLLRAGVLTGWIGSVKQIEGAQETAKNLISESIARFEVLQGTAKIAEAQTEIAYCYWRQGSYNEARIWLRGALDRLPADTDNELRAVALLRLAIVERSGKRFHDALRIHIDAAPIFDKSTNYALRGKFHNGFGFLLMNLGAAEKRNDYMDRALIEYAAASYHFEQAGHTRYQACVENNLGLLFSAIKKFPEAHWHLDRAQALFTSLKDSVHTAQVDDTRARVLLAEGRVSEAEKIVRGAVKILERGGEQSLLAEALTTHGLVLARLGSYEQARLTLQRAVGVAEGAGDSEAAGLAALTVVEEIAEHLPPHDLSAAYDRAAELLSGSENRESKDRLLACSRRVLFLVGSLPSPPAWEGFNFYDAVRRFEGRLIERALREAGGVVARAAQLLGIERRNLDSMLRRGRHKSLAHFRTPVEPRRRSLMFRDGVNCRDTRSVTVLHVEDDSLVAEAVRMTLDDEGWSVETCADGASAIEKLTSGARYDVLIFDYRLPDTNGAELIRETRAMAHRRRTPIIMLSGDETVETQTRRAGANTFLRKPEDIAALPETVARLLAQRSKQD